MIKKIQIHRTRIDHVCSRLMHAFHWPSIGRCERRADRGTCPHTAPTYLVRDNGVAYGWAFTSRIRATGMRDRSTCKGRPSAASSGRFAVAVSRFEFAVGTASSSGAVSASKHPPSQGWAPPGRQIVAAKRARDLVSAISCGSYLCLLLRPKPVL